MSLNFQLEPLGEAKRRFLGYAEQQHLECWEARLSAIAGAVTPSQWLCRYIIRLPKTMVIIGYCGFKAAPDKDGIVEIEYSILEPYRNQGYATSAVRWLVMLVEHDPKIRKIVAVVRSTNSQSRSVLTKNKFVESQYSHDSVENHSKNLLYSLEIFHSKKS